MDTRIDTLAKHLNNAFENISASIGDRFHFEKGFYRITVEFDYDSSPENQEQAITELMRWFQSIPNPKIQELCQDPNVNAFIVNIVEGSKLSPIFQMFFEKCCSPLPGRAHLHPLFEVNLCRKVSINT